MTLQVNKEDLSLYLNAAQSVKVDLPDMPAGNAFDPSLDGKVPEIFRDAIRQINPKRASELIQSAGIGLSVKAQAVAEGLAPMSPDVMEEIEQKDPYFVQQQRDGWMAKMTANLEQAAAQATEQGERQRQQLRSRGPNTATAQHCNEWNRRMQGQMGLPARRLTGR